MRLSIIVPIYNVVDYLRKCVDSLLNQDLERSDYEIVLVDDGSTDGSGAIADEYAAAFGHIRVIHQANAGLSGARNTGIRAARGEYVQFVDSDDYLVSNILGKVINKLYQNTLDVLAVGYQYVNANNEVVAPYKDNGRVVPVCRCVCDGETYLQTYQDYRCYAVQYIVRRDLAQNCLFTVGVYFEDTEWTPRMLCQARRVSAADMIVYNYLMREGSITQPVSMAQRRKVIDDKLLLTAALQRQMASKRDQRWYKGMIAQNVLSILGLVSADFFTERSSYIQQLEWQRIFPLSFYHATNRVKRKLFLINISPRLFCRCVALKMRLFHQ